MAQPGTDVAPVTILHGESRRTVPALSGTGERRNHDPLANRENVPAGAPGRRVRHDSRSFESGRGDLVRFLLLRLEPARSLARLRKLWTGLAACRLQARMEPLLRRSLGLHRRRLDLAVRL